VTVAFRVVGIPVGQPRPRACVRGRGPRARAGMYDPGTADGWKAAIAAAAAKHRPRSPAGGPIRVDADFVFPRPRYMGGAKYPEGEVPHDVKPDRDNCEKALLDALTGVGFWADDAQVCAGEVRKFYASRRGTPGVRVRVSAID